jgi:hypothetical protein
MLSTVQQKPEAWVAYNDADVDMFIYGLTPAAAQQKILVRDCIA